MKKLTYEYVKRFIEDVDGYILLSTEYTAALQKLNIKCNECNSAFEMTYGNFYQGHRCPTCANNIRNDKKRVYSHDDVKNGLEKVGYTLISDNYINSNDELSIKCQKGHTYTASWKTFKKGHRCPFCSGNHRNSIYEIKQYIEKEGNILLSTEYKNRDEKLKIQCPKNHFFNMSFGHFKGGERCPICSRISSKSENDVFSLIKSLYKGKIIKNDRNTIINPKTGRYLELDIYLPELNKALEYNGLYWHNVESVKCRDKQKQIQCNKNNIKLFVITDYEWLNKKKDTINNVSAFLGAV